MTILVVGASGATGRLLVEELLARGHQVRAIVRSLDRMPESVRGHVAFAGIEASLLDLDDGELSRHVEGCQAVASCLGHNLTWQGLFGRPRRLVADATRRLCDAIRSHQPAPPVRFVLMNSAGVRHRGLTEPVGFAQRCVVGLIRTLVPPHADNEQAAEFLRASVGTSDPYVEWAVVRPDSLTNDPEQSGYTTHPSPIRSAIFNAGTTSRANVAHFMTQLATDDSTDASGVWSSWRGQMPVVYNRDTR